METLYGESLEIQMDDGYDANNGIAVYSAGDGNGETITGGSGNQGSFPTSARIYWTITRIPSGDGQYSYEGGITGKSWFFNDPNSPFYPEDYNTEAEIWAIASAYNGNLDIIFAEWNSDKTQAGEIKRSSFMATISINAYGCSSTTVG